MRPSCTLESVAVRWGTVGGFIGAGALLIVVVVVVGVLLFMRRRRRAPVAPAAPVYGPAEATATYGAAEAPAQVTEAAQPEPSPQIDDVPPDIRPGTIPDARPDERA